MVTSTTPKVHMGSLTGNEAREILARKPVILLPMGSHEEQGPHAQMGDYLLAEKMAELIALRATERGTETLVAPVLPFGGADYFGAMPGGIAIGQDTLRAVIADMLGSLIRHDQTRLIVINGHGGNVGPVYDVTRKLFLEKGTVVPSLYLWKIANPLLTRIVGPEVVKRSRSHGADPLTSLGMHLFPDFVRHDMIPASGSRPPRGSFLDIPLTGWAKGEFEGVEVDLPLEYDATSPDGIGAGDPTLCSAETGAALCEALTEVCARFVAHYSQHVPA
ncbi:creatininase family protein [Roseomonas sp. BN140053]|uniref:creatininase family protein n=1 Tax=Roseomonas sp. BN140053 TaxID=3391898 RepID=UPI0039E7D511